ncbi:hypothetical protein Tco_1530204 [Tanacetum coccineum]
MPKSPRRDSPYVMGFPIGSTKPVLMSLWPIHHGPGCKYYSYGAVLHVPHVSTNTSYMQPPDLVALGPQWNLCSEQRPDGGYSTDVLAPTPLRSVRGATEEPPRLDVTSVGSSEDADVAGTECELESLTLVETQEGHQYDGGARQEVPPVSLVSRLLVIPLRRDACCTVPKTPDEISIPLTTEDISQSRINGDQVPSFEVRPSVSAYGDFVYGPPAQQSRAGGALRASFLVMHHSVTEGMKRIRLLKTQ